MTVAAGALQVLRPFAAVFYGLIKLLRPVRHKVTFLSRQCDELSVDFSLLRADLAATDRTLELKALCCTDATCRSTAFGHLTKVLRELWHIANSQAVVLDGYSVAVSYFPQRRNLYVLQCWHALGALKRFSWQSVDTPGGRSLAIARALRMHANYSTLLCGGEASRVIFSHAFRIARSRIRCVPLPRCDVLRAPDPNRLELLAENWPDLVASRPLVFYAPTFRDTDEDYARWREELERLAGALQRRGATLVVKTHFRCDAKEVSTSITDLGAIVNPDVDTLDLLMLADQVVTDYSAVSFEAAVAGKPLWFFIPDIEVYEGQRGLNVDPREEMPESCFEDAEELADAVVAAVGSSPGPVQKKFMERYVQMSHIPSAKQISRLIFEQIA